MWIRKHNELICFDLLLRSPHFLTDVFFQNKLFFNQITPVSHISIPYQTGNDINLLKAYSFLMAWSSLSFPRIKIFKSHRRIRKQTVNFTVCFPEKSESIFHLSNFFRKYAPSFRSKQIHCKFYFDGTNFFFVSSDLSSMYTFLLSSTGSTLPFDYFTWSWPLIFYFRYFSPLHLSYFNFLPK